MAQSTESALPANLPHCTASHAGEGGQPQAALVQAADGNFYGTQLNASGLFRITPAGNMLVLTQPNGANFQGGLVQGSDGSFFIANSYRQILQAILSPALAPPVQLTVPAAVTRGASFTLNYTVVNAASQSMARCVAANSAGDVSGWNGVKAGSATGTAASLTAPLAPGAYTYSLTCGGVESGFVTLNVN